MKLKDACSLGEKLWPTSVNFNCSFVSDYLGLLQLQHAKPPCPLSTPGIYSNSCHWVSDTLQPSHPLSSPSPPTFTLSQHHTMDSYKWVSSSYQVAKVALTRWTFVGKVMSLLFNMLSRLIITFLPRSKHLLISWLQLPSAVILSPPSPQSNKVFLCFHYFPIYLPWSDGTRCYDLTFLNVEF